MFKPLDYTITRISESTYLKFIGVDAPFYSKLELYHNDDLISECGFKCQEKDLIKNNCNNLTDLINSLKILDSQINSTYLKEFIGLVEGFINKNESHQNHRLV